jgi:hypothetical protein
MCIPTFMHSDMGKFVCMAALKARGPSSADARQHEQMGRKKPKPCRRPTEGTIPLGTMQARKGIPARHDAPSELIRESKARNPISRYPQTCDTIPHFHCTGMDVWSLVYGSTYTQESAQILNNGTSVDNLAIDAACTWRRRFKGFSRATCMMIGNRNAHMAKSHESPFITTCTTPRHGGCVK